VISRTLSIVGHMPIPGNLSDLGVIRIREPLGAFSAFAGLPYIWPLVFPELVTSELPLELTTPSVFSELLLSEQNSFSGTIDGLLSYSSLPYSHASSNETESYQSYLSEKNLSLNRKLPIFVGSCGFALCTSFGVWILRRGGEDRNSRLIMYCILFFIVAILGQGSVFLVLKGLWGY